MTRKGTSLWAYLLVAGLVFAMAVSTSLGRGGGGASGGRGGGAGSPPRPSMGPSASRPSPRPAANVSRPASGAAAPSLPALSQVSKPSARPAPTPAQRPSLGVSRPSTPANKPATRPAIAERPSTPSISGERPSLGNVNRPSISTPGVATRPAPRPTPGVERPGGGGESPRNWHCASDSAASQTRRRCWSGHWGNYWYAPMVAGATAWGLSAVLPRWGYSYGYTYSNPYYVESAAPAYDYSQPIVINTYNAPTAEESAESTSPPAAPAAVSRRPPRPTSYSTKPWPLSRRATTEAPWNWISRPCRNRRKIQFSTKSGRCACSPRATMPGRRQS